MKEFIRNFNDEKLAEAYRIKEAYRRGEIDIAMANAQMKAHVGSLSPEELAYIEQEFQELVDDECIKESLKDMLAVYDGVLTEGQSFDGLPAGHPIRSYVDENRAIRVVIARIDGMLDRRYVKNEWDEQLEALGSFRIHLSRKQNQLYSALERKGFDRPTQTMWLYDNEIRDRISDFSALIAEKEDTQDPEVQERWEALCEHLADLMSKEETILYPTALELLTDSEIDELAQGDAEIGFALIDPPSHRASRKPSSERVSTLEGESRDRCGREDRTSASFEQELSELMRRHGFGGWTPDTPMDVSQGVLSLNQINLLFRHLPVDISYVDENELVAFYSDTAHRVFPRSKGVIGREVKNCHPKNSVAVVEEIIAKFRSGEQDRAEFWISKPGVFIYILYVAVRDQQGNFRGVMEMMQDCSRIRALEGSRTLLCWADDAAEERAESDESGAETGRAGESGIAENNEPSELAGETGAAEITVTPDTKLADLLRAYPPLKQELPEIHSAFQMLNSPMGKLMLPKATVRMMSERSGMPLNQLTEEIRRRIISY